MRRVIFALLIGLIAAASTPARADPGPIVAVRTESRPGFGRVAFDFPSRVRFSVAREGERVTIEFTSPLTVGSPAALPRNVSSLKGSAGRAEIVVATGAQIRPGRADNRIIIDVLDSSAPSPSPPAQTTTPAVAPSTVSSPPAAAVDPGSKDQGEITLPQKDQVEKAEPPAAEQSPSIPQRPDTASAAQPPSAQPLPARPLPGPVALVARTVETPAGRAGWAFAVPFEPAVGAAAFRRGGSVLVVFDERRPIDLAELRSDPALGSAAVQLLPASTIIRVPAPPGAEISLQRTSDGWVVASWTAASALKSLNPRVAEQRVLLPADAPGKVVTILDPDTGANVLVGTQRQAGQGVAAARRAPEFALLPTWQGVAVEPLSDRLTLTAAQDGFVLSAIPGGLALAAEPENADALVAADTLTRRFDFTAAPSAELMGRLQSQVSAAAAAPPLARGPKRRVAAQTMIALGLGAEAVALLQLASVEDAREAENPDTEGLLAIASLLADRPESAELLGDPRLDGTDEIALWRAVKAAQLQEGSSSAAKAFAATAPLALAYPQALRARLLPLMAETMILGGEAKAAESLMAKLAEDPELALARALLLESRHEEEPALAAYDSLAAGRDRLIRVRAARWALELRLATGRIDAGQAAAAMERLLYAWRGDQREFEMRLRLAALQADAGAWRPALASLRETEPLFPDRQEEIRAHLQQVFAALLQDRNADKLPPLDLVALVGDNADLVPDGEAGETLAARLADRLMALDLPRRAGPVLEKLMSGAPAGSARAGFGARLAALRLQEADPAGALAALSASAADGLPPPLVERRGLLFARASGARGDTAGAVAALAELGTPAADDARAAILESAKDWPAAERALTAFVAKTVPPEGRLDEGQRRTLLRLATAAAQAGDEATLAGLRRREATRMAGGPLGDMFRLLTSGPVQNVADLPRAGQEMVLARGVSRDLRSLAENRKESR